MENKIQKNVPNARTIKPKPSCENEQYTAVPKGAVTHQPVYLDARFAHNTPWCLLPGCGHPIDKDPTRPDAIFCTFHENQADEAWLGTLNITGCLWQFNQ